LAVISHWYLKWKNTGFINVAGVAGFARKLAFRPGLGIRSALQLPMHCIFLLYNPEKCIIPPGMGFAKLMPKLTFQTKPKWNANLANIY